KSLANQWDLCNSVVLSWILGSISQDLYLGQCFFTSPKEVWDELKETYDKLNGSETFNLHHQINSLKQNGTLVSDYYHTLNGPWRQFCAITKLLACSCTVQKAFKTHTDLIKLMQFLMGLDDVYQPIRSSLLTRDHIPDVKTDFSIISREESNRGSSSFFGNKAQTFVFAKKVHNNNNFKKNSSAKNPNLVCTNPNCGLTGHTIEKCYKIVGYPEHIKKKWANNGNNNNQRNFSSNNSSTSTVEVPTSAALSLTTDQIQQLINMLNSKPQRNIHANMAGTVYCSNSKTFFKVYKTDKGWIIDSRANQHMDLHLKKTLRISSQHEGLYFLDFNNKPETFIKCNNMICHSNTLWHYRLGHPSDQVLKALKDRIDIRGNGDFAPCDICHEAKQTREPFPISDHKTTNLGDIVHLDVWGPYRITSREGYKYFLTVVDDFSRAVWLYLLKSKDEVTLNVIEFYNYLKNQFNKTIKIFRSDNGIEFTNSNMNSFFKQRGIIHQTSCAYTPQQNGVAKRKHRHLLNVARSLLFQGGIPLYLWSECVLTATYLINRLPSCVLKESTKSPSNDDAETYSHGDNEISFAPRGINEDVSESDSTLLGNFNDATDREFVTSPYDDITMEKSSTSEDNHNITNVNSDQPNLRKSSRTSKLLTKLSDFVLNKNNTWVITDLPLNRKPIGCKWIYKIKYKSNKEIERYKARLVAKGYNQREGVDYDETFSSVVKMVTVRCLISMVVNQGCPLFQLDVNKAFLYGNLSGDVYMTLPLGYFSMDD
ncbi:ribonuclease H-like domain-containing protein, partial [Tanacetum coccineum]